MKNILLIVLTGITILSCKTEINEKVFTLNADFKDLPDGEIYITRQMISEVNDSLIIRTDTISKSMVSNGKFKIEGEIDHPEELNFSMFKEIPNYGKTLLGIGSLWIAPGTQTYSGYLGEFPTIHVAEGEFGKKIYAYQQSEAHKEALKEYKEIQANPNNDLETNSLRMHASQKLARVKYEPQSKVFKEYADHPFFAALMFQKDLQGDNLDFEKLVLKKDSIKNLLTEYDQTAIVMLDKGFALVKGRTENVALGMKYTDVIGTNRNGEEIKLSDVLKENKYVLLDFWASWCGPCRGEFPYMKDKYPEYHDKGFEIFALSIDKKEDAWIKASDEEKMDWTDVRMDPDAPYANNYQVTGIPANFLIDSKGTIIAKDLRHDGLGNKLKELLDN